jgi:preprotein translocase subunit SecA
MSALTSPEAKASGGGVGERLAPACTLAPLDTLPKGLDAIVHALRGWVHRVFDPAKRLMSQAQAVRQACDRLDSASAQDLSDLLNRARAAMQRDPAHARGQREEVLALVGQMAARALGLRPHPVQFMGALALHEGLLAEMATGEGKTLTVGMAGVLAGLSGRPCHVITANDYLAERDATDMLPLYEACGLRLNWITGNIDPGQRHLRYDADVVYLTAKELLADYLRDGIGPGSPVRLARARFDHWLYGPTGGESELRQLVRGLHTAIIDEADSILIDEAVTPLILAAPHESRGLAEAVRVVSALADTLSEGDDYVIEGQDQQVRLLAFAQDRLAALALHLPEVWRPAPRREELLRQALVVRCFFKAGQHYLIQEGEVVLLDEFTGRLTPGRSLTAGLHQAIEAFEGLNVTDPNQSLTQMSFQTFFRRFRKLGGCSGTLDEAWRELWRVYGRPLVHVPTHRPRLVHHRRPTLVADSAERWAGIVREALHEAESGRPVLVGLRSVGASLALADAFALKGVKPTVLNALAHEDEARIVAAAGQAGAITIATNMAGRGTDIRLGAGVAERGGLHVIVAEVNDSARIDRQLAGRCGRQGDPGSVSTWLCLQDDLVVRLMPVLLQRILLAFLRTAPVLASFSARYTFRYVQRRSEAAAFLRRLSVLRADDWMSSALPFEGPSAGPAS